MRLSLGRAGLILPVLFVAFGGVQPVLAASQSVQFSVSFAEERGKEPN
jgi:hypothetical protein